ncbi:cation diffusion facilitator family transporter [Paenibacillus protaetiae]|uniref:Cation diffusion facilitator family transporter n=1 Tax=Paenibacillus protaetiae TaxID=2509456 RepID=A0A4P6F467_9BACL|nr:cation diffusion facilitator family transporter [Paenibacillus protaetiae]QAY65188.1 cation diffusion facilitator family transporter [Paenibacillus protaetiae]
MRDVKAESMSGLWGSALLALLKGIVGWLSGSKALLADAFHSAAELSGSIAKLAASRSERSGSREPDSKGANTGNTRAEEIVSVVLSACWLVIGLEIGISALRDFSLGIEEAPHWSAVVMALAGLLVKQLLFRSRQGHAGLYSSLAVLAGAGGALIGKAASLPLLYYFDPAASIVIAVMMIANGYRLIVSAVRTEPQTVYPAKDTEDMMQLVQRIEGVVTVESLKAKEQGHYVVADIVISVNPRISMMEGQEIGKRVKQLVLKRFAHVTDVSIYVEAYNPGYPYKSNHDPNQEQMTTLIQ